MMKHNPLCDFAGLPRFSEFQVVDVKPAISSLLDQAEKVIEQVSLQQESTWDNTVEPVMRSMDQLRRAWGQVGHLNSVISSEPLRSVYNELLPKVTEFYSRLSQNKKIYQCFKDVSAAQKPLLSQERKKYLDNELRDYRLSGVDLGEREQNRYQDLSKRLASLSALFSDNVLDATDDYVLNVEERSRLEGLPAAVLFEAKAKASSLDQEGWSFTLKAPCWIPFMESCRDRSLREEMYHAYVTRASEYGNQTFDNSTTIVDILSARHEKAKLLGFDSYAHLSFATKMAAEPQRALDLMAELSDRARHRAVSELQMLSDYASSHLGMQDLMPWDISFVAQKIKEERYSFKDEDLRQYFPLRKVVEGLFDLLEDLYGISVVDEKTKAWDPNVKLFAVSDRAGSLLGYFYMDLFARDGKRPGAWMDDAIGRWKTEQHTQLPVAYLVCNFPSPSAEASDAYLSHGEVETLFHECGHVMHHLMTQIDEVGISGINGVEWDAVELPSQFMENFCWDWGIIKKISSDVSGQGHMPESLFKKMVEAKNFMSGIQTLRQVEFSVFDLRIHLGEPPKNPEEVMGLLDDIRKDLSVIPVPPYNRFPNSFSHIFAGGYAAGYYSYKWAEVLSADAFGMSQEESMSLSDIGTRFLGEVISQGGLRSSLENFIQFRGREPTIDALLQHTGLIEAVRSPA
jgi:oligopeptidase A